MRREGVGTSVYWWWPRWPSDSRWPHPHLADVNEITVARFDDPVGTETLVLRLECPDLCQLGDGRSHEACDRIRSCTEPSRIDLEGPAAAEAARAAVNSGLLTVLATDAATADRLL